MARSARSLQQANWTNQTLFQLFIALAPSYPWAESWFVLQDDGRVRCKTSVFPLKSFCACSASKPRFRRPARYTSSVSSPQAKSRHRSTAGGLEDTHWMRHQYCMSTWRSEDVSCSAERTSLWWIQLPAATTTSINYTLKLASLHRSLPSAFKCLPMSFWQTMMQVYQTQRPQSTGKARSYAANDFNVLCCLQTTLTLENRAELIFCIIECKHSVVYLGVQWQLFIDACVASKKADETAGEPPDQGPGRRFQPCWSQNFCQLGNNVPTSCTSNDVQNPVCDSGKISRRCPATFLVRKRLASFTRMNHLFLIVVIISSLYDCCAMQPNLYPWRLSNSGKCVKELQHGQTFRSWRLSKLN